MKLVAFSDHDIHGGVLPLKPTCFGCFGIWVSSLDDSCFTENPAPPWSCILSSRMFLLISSIASFTDPWLLPREFKAFTTDLRMDLSAFCSVWGEQEPVNDHN